MNKLDLIQGGIISALAAAEEEVLLLLAEIETMRAIHAAQLSATRAVARRKALEEALAACGVYDDGGSVRNAITALLNATD
ncbi:hypothetical protein [Burkholderia cepacia]|uniref:hypothetical protein n=1 Tax=Burkholderia cepacia TaxID=292 RepID=UPI00075E244F|nr:hypothetical protein [Burkholderia cepacia]KVX59325.1 hypothetical protein WL06_05845 [Burkholderia cepacia]KWD63391.1 hypothetical protein WL68_00490 [Burkholderia cepacia]KWD84415.1 hypothetical protein WL69_12725 [Burkholderia cepacia]